MQSRARRGGTTDTTRVVLFANPTTATLYFLEGSGVSMLRARQIARSVSANPLQVVIVEAGGSVAFTSNSATARHQTTSPSAAPSVSAKRPVASTLQDDDTLGWDTGFAILATAFVVCALGVLLFWKRKKWRQRVDLTPELEWDHSNDDDEVAAAADIVEPARSLPTCGSRLARHQAGRYHGIDGTPRRYE